MNDPYILLRIVLASRSHALHRALLSSRTYAAVARVHRTQLVHTLTAARPYPRNDGVVVWRHCDTGKLHREDGPSLEYVSGTKMYHINGELHRENGPAIDYGDGTMEYYIHGKRHRDDGPAFVCLPASTEYWLNGELHRVDGPAIERPDGSVEYRLDGKKVTREEFEKRRKNKKRKRS